MATVTKSIGTSKDYTTITLWEADLDNTGVYASGDVAVGECYNQVYDETFTINGGGTVGLASRKLTVAAGNRHNGTAGTGARIVNSVDRAAKSIAIGNTTVEWLEVDCNGKIAYRAFITNHGGTKTVYFNNLIIHKLVGYAWQYVAGIEDAYGYSYATNNIIYDIIVTGYDSSGFKVASWELYNNTVHNIKANTSGNVKCYNFDDVAGSKLKNNIGTDPGGTTSGTKACFSITSPSNATLDYNLSSDTTAYGTHSLVSKTSANQFVSNVEGSEDLHLKAGADAINTGVDLGTTPTGVNVDINGYDRDSGGVVWDIGAHEYIGTQETVTLDKWFKPSSEPVRRIVNSTLTPSFSYIPAINTWPVALTNWYQQHPDPVKKIFVLTAASFFYTAILGLDPVLLSTWYQPPSEPVRAAAPYRQQPALCSQWTPGPVTETITLDKWYKPQPDPVRSRYITTASSFFYTPAINTWAVPLEGWNPQYTEPIRSIPQTKSESFFYVYKTPSFDWYIHQSVPIRSIPRSQPSYNFYEVALNRWDVKLSQWYQEASNPTFIKPKCVEPTSYVFPFKEVITPPVVETVTVDKWYRPASEPVRTIQRIPYFQYLSYVYVPPLTSDYQPYSGRFQYQSLAEAVKTTSDVPAITSDYQAYKGRYQYQEFVEHVYVEIREKQPFDWYIQYPDPVRRKYQVIDSHRPCAAIEEEASVDKWYQVFPNPILPKGRCQPEINLTFAYTPSRDYPVPLDSWYQQHPNPVRKTPGYLYHQEYINQWTSSKDYFVDFTTWYSPTSTPLFNIPKIQEKIDISWIWYSVKVEVELDKWYQRPSEPVFVAPRSQPQITYYQQWVPSRDLPVSLDKWYVPTSTPVLPKPKYIQQQITYYQRKPEEIQALDKWYQPISIPTRRVARTQPQTTITYVWTPLRTGEVPLNSWYQPTSQPLIIIRRHQPQVEIFQIWPIPRTYFVEFTSWYSETVQLIRLYPSLDYIKQECYIYEIPEITRRSLPIFLLGLS